MINERIVINERITINAGQKLKNATESQKAIGQLIESQRAFTMKTIQNACWWKKEDQLLACYINKVTSASSHPIDC